MPMLKKSLTKEKKPGKNWLSIADQPVFDRKFDNKHTCTVRSWWNPIILNCISCGTGADDNIKMNAEGKLLMRKLSESVIL